MEKAIVFMQEDLAGEPITTYYIIPKDLDTRLRGEVKGATIKTFATREEAEAAIK